MIKRLFFNGTYQIGNVSLNVSFYVTIINVLKTRDDVYVCVPGA